MYRLCQCPYCSFDISIPNDLDIKDGMVLLHGRLRKTWEEDSVSSFLYGCGKPVKCLLLKDKWIGVGFEEPLASNDPLTRTRFFLTCCYPTYKPEREENDNNLRNVIFCGEGCYYRNPPPLIATSASDPDCVTLNCGRTTSIYTDTIVCEICAVPGMPDYKEHHKKCCSLPKC